MKIFWTSGPRFKKNFIWGTSIGGHENFFRTRDLRQPISRARKPPSTKNQSIWNPHRGSKNFLELGTCANRFLVPENPRVPNQPIWRKKFFREAYWACTPPFNEGYPQLKSVEIMLTREHFQLSVRNLY
jgi:hypothetical protein